MGGLDKRLESFKYDLGYGAPLYMFLLVTGGKAELDILVTQPFEPSC